MDKGLQVVIAIVVTASLITVFAYSMGWFTETSSATIKCYIHHHEGDEDVLYVISEGFAFNQPYSSEVSGEVGPGETAEVVIRHEWRGTGPSDSFMEYELWCYNSGNPKTYWDVAEFQVIPGGSYQTECHIYLDDYQTNASWSLEDTFTLYPVSGEPLTPPYSTNLSLDIRNGYADDWNQFTVFIDGVIRTNVFLGPLSSRNVTIPVGWDTIYSVYEDTIHYASVEVYSGNPFALTYAELVAIGDGAEVSVTITA